MVAYDRRRHFAYTVGDRFDDAAALIAWRRTMLRDAMTETLDRIRRVVEA